MTILNVQKKLTTTIVLLALMLTGCAVTPQRLDNDGQDQNHRFMRKVVHTPQRVIDQFFNAQTTQINTEKPKTNSLLAPVFSSGDMLQLHVSGMNDLNGLYQITAQGTLELPFVSNLKAAGLSRESLITLIESELIHAKWFHPDSVKVNVSQVRLAPAQITIAGAVFNPGRVSVNNQPTQKQDDIIQQIGGAYSSGRDLVAAIAAAGGVRPDADLTRVYLKRDDHLIQIPLTALITGDNVVQTPTLVNNDQILIESTGSENVVLIKPSQITPPGMRVFMSNLTAPALTNAQSAVGADATRMPYGSSLLDSAISANCIGGTHQANASRSVVLVTRNYGSAEQLVIRRSINQLVAHSSDSSVNPYVMPNDGIACYDSRFTNFRDVASGIGELVGPILLGTLR